MNDQETGWEDSVCFGETGSADRERSVLDVGRLYIALCPLPASNRVLAWVPTRWAQAGATGVSAEVKHGSLPILEPLYIVTLHLTVWETAGRPWAQWVCEDVCKPVPGELRVTPANRAPYLWQLQRAVDRWVLHMWAGEPTNFPVWFAGK